MIIELYLARYLLGRHRLAVEAYLQAEDKLEKPDWEIHHNLGNLFKFTQHTSVHHKSLEQHL